MISMAKITLRCSACHEPFEWIVRARGRYPKTCSPKCDAARRREWNCANRHRYRTDKPREKIHHGECVICGAPFESVDRRTRTCGLTCGAALSYQTKVPGRRAKTIAQRTRICEACGRSFVMHKPSAKARRGEVREGRFCSRRCWHSAMRKPQQLSLFKDLPPRRAGDRGLQSGSRDEVGTR